MQNQKLGGLLIFALLLGGFLLLRRTPAVTVYNPSPTLHLRPRTTEPAESIESGGRRYRNTETWDINWNEDGLPTKITVHRDAVQT